MLRFFEISQKLLKLFGYKKNVLKFTVLKTKQREKKESRYWIRYPQRKENNSKFNRKTYSRNAQLIGEIVWKNVL